MIVGNKEIRKDIRTALAHRARKVATIVQMVLVRSLAVLTFAIAMLTENDRSVHERNGVRKEGGVSPTRG